MEGVVVKSTGSWYSVKTENGNILECRLKGKFKLENLKTTNPIAVGDHVIVDTSEGDTVITDWYERKNYITRESPRHEHARHIIAANLDQACLVVTISQPRTSTGFIDRFLITAEAFHIPAFIIINKQDVYSEKELKKQQELLNIYAMAGYEVITASAITGLNMELLKEKLKDKVTLIAGHSGVGKSTLV